MVKTPELESPTTGNNSLDVPTLLGHPAGLFILFFTEMWERFSYYGMRALLVLFLISDITKGGWAWTREEALSLYGDYTALVYVTPIFGGIIADKLLGHRRTVFLGALLMTLGHASMALETPYFFYLGLGLLIAGNGAFKPNISSIVGSLYENFKQKKDAAYTIFYMGINAGAFLGILLCGYLGEKIGWSFGFGLAGVFMMLGMFMFYFAGPIFGSIGLLPKKIKTEKTDIEKKEFQRSIARSNKRLMVWSVIGLIIGSILVFLMKNFELEGNPWILGFLVGLIVSVIGFTVTDPRLSAIEKDRVWVVIILSLFTIFFWMAFEQAGGSMTIFAKDYTDNVLESGQALAFKIINTLLTVIPLAIVTYVLLMLIRRTFKIIPLSNIFILLSFVIIWSIAIWMLVREFKADVAEIPASWYGILNSFFIIAFAPLFSKLWEKWNPAGPIKFGLGLILLGLGFGVLAYGGLGIPDGAKTASISMVWLIGAYWLHTMGELCLSPVGLSYVSKLAPLRLTGMMFGVWFGFTALANYLAGWTGSSINKISDLYGMSGFFLIYTLIPVLAGLILWGLNKTLKKKMHGID